MGLDIHGDKTGGHVSGGYSRLHYTARYLALLFCGMPEYLDDAEELRGMHFYMSPFGIIGKNINPDKVRDFLTAIQISGKEFPNLLLHSDCGGTYTRRGKVRLEDFMTGNSVALMKELEMLVNEKEFQVEKYVREMEYTKAFYELVKNEVENGSGRITFD